MKEALIVRTQAELLELQKTVATWNYCAFDIETTGLNPRKDKIIGFSVAEPYTEFHAYVVLKEFKNGELATVIDEAIAAPFIASLKSKKLLTWNGSFDTRFVMGTFNTKLWPSIYCDAMLAKHTTNENSFNYKLKDSAVEELGAWADNAQTDMIESIKANGGSAKEYYKADSALLAKYGAIDALLTAKLFLIYDSRIKAQNLTKFFYEDEVMPLYREVTIDMEWNGIRVDVPLLTKTYEEIKETLEKLEAEIQSDLAPLLDQFNYWYVNRHFPVKLSGPFLQAFAELKQVDLPKTKTGAYSFTAKNIEKLPDCEFKDVIQLRKRISSADIAAVQSKMLADSGVKYPFNILSKDHLKRLFFTKLNETPVSTTDLGNPQVDDEFLTLMAEKYDWAKKLQKYNKLTKIKGTYIERFIEEIEGEYFYPSFAQHRTVSGRYGSDFQQLPRPYEPQQQAEIDSDIYRFTNIIRAFFIADEGCIIVDDDYESLEPHVFAHVADDEGLRNIFRIGEDFYSRIAINTEKLTEYSADKKAPNYLGKLNKPKRQAAKPYALGVPYGLSSYKLAFELGFNKSSDSPKSPQFRANVEKAQKLINAYIHEGFPALGKWMQRSRELALKQGYITTESGRVRRFPELKDAYAKYGNALFDGLELYKAYEDAPAVYAKAKEAAGRCKNALNNAMNVQIQGLAASIVNRSAIAIARAFKANNVNARLLAQIHDELVINCSVSDVEQVCAIVQNCMENTYRISIPLKAVPSTGQNLLEAKG